MSEYVADRLFSRLIQPWTLPKSDWRLCIEDWARVTAIIALPWSGRILDVGSGDGTLAATLLSVNPNVRFIEGVEQDPLQVERAFTLWVDFVDPWPVTFDTEWPEAGERFDGVLLCEVLEHMNPHDGAGLMVRALTCCTPGALVCVTVPSAGGSRAEYPGHVRKFTADSLRVDMINAGTTEPRLSFIQPDPDEHAIWIMGVAHAK